MKIVYYNKHGDVVVVRLDNGTEYRTRISVFAKEQPELLKGFLLRRKQNVKTKRIDKKTES